MLPNFLKQRAYLTPNRIALVSQGESLTFAGLYEKAKELARKLSGCGMQAEDTAAVLLNSRAETVAILHALQQLRVRTLFLNHRLTTAEMQYQLTDSGAKWLITEKAFREKTEVLNETATVIQSEALGDLPAAGYEERAEFALGMSARSCTHPAQLANQKASCKHTATTGGAPPVLRSISACGKTIRGCAQCRFFISAVFRS